MKKILIVDDAKLMRNIIRKTLLEDKKYVIFEAANGEDALECYKVNQPDLVTMDMAMDQKNGLDTAREILSFDRFAKIVIITSMGQERLMRDCIEAGIADFIVKPFSKERIRKTISNILELN